MIWLIIYCQALNINQCCISQQRANKGTNCSFFFYWRTRWIYSDIYVWLHLCIPCVHGLCSLIFAMHPSSLWALFQCHSISQDEHNTLAGCHHVHTCLTVMLYVIGHGHLLSNVALFESSAHTGATYSLISTGALMLVQSLVQDEPTAEWRRKHTLKYKMCG